MTGRSRLGRFTWLVALLAGATLVGGCAPAPAATDRIVAAAANAPGPTPSSRTGGLVEGFPDVVPVPGGGHLTASAVQPEGDLLGVCVTGESPVAAPALLAWFRGRLQAEGFTTADAPRTPPGAVGATFARPGGLEMLVVAIVDRGTRRSWSVGGTVARRPGRG